MLIVDTGVLLAAADVSDPDHDVCAALLRDEPGDLLTTALVIAETAYLSRSATRVLCGGGLLRVRG